MQRSNHPIRQLGLVVAGFVAVILLLESQGLADWAKHLEIGPLRTVAVPVTEDIRWALAPLGMGAVREHALTALARVGWADDAAEVAEASQPVPAVNCGTVAATGIPGGVARVGGGAPTLPRAGAGTAYPKAPGSQAPLVSDLPRATALAPLPPIEPGRQRVVALAGDSMMAVGLSATLMRQAAGDKNLRIVKVFKSGTGLARPEVFNWMDEYPAMLGAEKPDVVIVAIGANDGQGFVVDGKVLAYGTEGWRQVYQDRLASYLAMVSATGARVVWVGLPPMRIPVYNQKIDAINHIAYTVVSQAPQATWWNPVPFVGDENGGFREFAALPNGQQMRVRAVDGIHLSDEGAGLLTSVLMKWLDPPPPVSAVSAPAAGTEPVQPMQKTRRRVRRAMKS